MKYKISIALKIILIALLLLIISGCKTKEIVVPVEKTVVEYRDQLRIDSVYNRDTVNVYERGDTVYLQTIKWRERFRIDTVSVVKVDSIPYTVEVVKEVNRLTKWQRWRLTMLNIIGGLIIVYIAFKIGKGKLLL